MHWNSIIGLDEAKRLIKEAVVYPIKVSSLGNVRAMSSFPYPWKHQKIKGIQGILNWNIGMKWVNKRNTSFQGV